jgi:hypothetical protein
MKGVLFIDAFPQEQPVRLRSRDAIRRADRPDLPSPGDTSIPGQGVACPLFSFKGDPTMNDLLFCVGCVLGCIQRHPLQSIAALGVCLGRAVVTLSRFARQCVYLLGRAWRAIDGPFVRAVGPVMGLVMLAQWRADPGLPIG